MNHPIGSRSSNPPRSSDAEQTLRVIASVPVPDGLEDRVHDRLRAAPRQARVLAWPTASHSSGWVRGVAAAAIVLVVAGGSWGVYSRVAPGQPGKGVSGPRIPGPGEFSGSAAPRRPQTLQGPVVPPLTPAVAHPETNPKPKVKIGNNKVGQDATTTKSPK